MKKIIFIMATLLSFPTFGDESTKEKPKAYTECVNIWGPTILDSEDLETNKSIDKDDVLQIPKGWTPVNTSVVNASATVILLCR